MKQIQEKFDLRSYLTQWLFRESDDLFTEKRKTRTEYLDRSPAEAIPKYINEFWTARQRQSNSLHEISYRACFKPQLPHFFISILTKPGDIVYDPFAGRGTTAVEAALMGRDVISNDINPLSAILTQPRLWVPECDEVHARLNQIEIQNMESDMDLSMFYEQETLNEILSLRAYLKARAAAGEEDAIDSWIRMVATNRLTGHSPGFFSVYTLPPNQATYPERQKKINEKRQQIPTYRDTKALILRKTQQLIQDIDSITRTRLREIASKAVFLECDARETNAIPDESVALTVTSPPFLNVVHYALDNWLRCWFNSIDAAVVGKKITVISRLEDWCDVMQSVFDQLFRITKSAGYVAFEVGEVLKGKINLDEYVVTLGMKSGFVCEGIMINEQVFTKTANIWGVSNNERGTNSNRIVLFSKR